MGITTSRLEDDRDTFKNPRVHLKKMWSTVSTGLTNQNRGLRSSRRRATTIQRYPAITHHSLETAPEKELDTGPVKEVEAPPNGVMADEDPPNGVRVWLKFTAPEPGVDDGGWFCCSCVGSGP